MYAKETEVRLIKKFNIESLVVSNFVSISATSLPTTIDISHAASVPPIYLY